MTDRPATPQPGTGRPGDDEFVSTASRLLRQSADELDAASAARLNRARQAALAHVADGRSSAAWLLPALAAAALGVLAVALWLSPGVRPDGAAPAIESATDVDLLLAEDSLEMLQDLEFYAWLDAELSAEELRAEPEPAG